MFVNIFAFLLVGKPFYQAYFNSDVLGKMIFFSLLLTSICSWTILIKKIILTHQAKKNSISFLKVFGKNKNHPLNLEGEGRFKQSAPNPFYELYAVLRKSAIDILNKNRRFGSGKSEGAFLSYSDIEILSSQLGSSIEQQTKQLEKNLFILSTVAGLSPLLGLLGTVWGILTFFSDLQSPGAAGSNQLVLSGISLALTTTVLGIVNAIPALVAYNYIKNSIQSFVVDMDGFSSEMLSSLEMQYRKVEP